LRRKRKSFNFFFCVSEIFLFYFLFFFLVGKKKKEVEKEEKMIEIKLQSSDDQVFKVSKEVAGQSILIKNMLEGLISFFFI